MHQTEEGAPDGYVLADSVTQIASLEKGQIVLCGSHGGRFSALCALDAGVAGIVFNDAAVGRDQAGIDGLNILDEHGIPAAAVGRTTSVIGSAAETASGRISYVNSVAAGLGVGLGMTPIEFTERVGEAEAAPSSDLPLPVVEESRRLIVEAPLRVWALDSVSLAKPSDDGTVLVTGSHAQLLGGDAESALRADARVAVFNDAGGVVPPSRLDVLEARGIAAVAATASSARIGEAMSTYSEGVISAANATAVADGAAGGMKVADYVSLIIHRVSEAGVK